MHCLSLYNFCIDYFCCSCYLLTRLNVFFCCYITVVFLYCVVAVPCCLSWVMMKLKHLSDLALGLTWSKVLISFSELNVAIISKTAKDLRKLVAFNKCYFFFTYFHKYGLFFTNFKIIKAKMRSKVQWLHCITYNQVYNSS